MLLPIGGSLLAGASLDSRAVAVWAAASAPHSPSSIRVS